MEPLFVVAIIVVVVVVAVAGLVLARRRRAPAPGTSVTSEPSTRRTGSAGGFPSEGLGDKIRSVFTGRSDGADLGGELERLLLTADVGPRAASDLVARIQAGSAGAADPVAALREEIIRILGPDQPLHLPEGRTSVVLVVGVNGSGKTTTIGKLAALFSGQGLHVMIAAADTFRAAAGEQLEVWAARSGVTVIGQERGADPGAVAHDAVAAATARGADVLLVDTAGRLHTKTPLMDELRKIRRVIEKAGGAIDETLLVLDAQTGQNGIAQVRAFTDAVDVTGVVLTKTDGSARGGIVLAVREELGVPVRFVGVGEAVGDLQPFSAAAFADRLLGG